jgi:hypothetical protein
VWRASPLSGTGSIASNQAGQGCFQDSALITTFVLHSLPRGSSVHGKMKITKRTREAKLRGISLITVSVEITAVGSKTWSSVGLKIYGHNAGPWRLGRIQDFAQRSPQLSSQGSATAGSEEGFWRREPDAETGDEGREVPRATCRRQHSRCRARRLLISPYVRLVIGGAQTLAMLDLYSTSARARLPPMRPSSSAIVSERSRVSEPPSLCSLGAQ